MKRGLAPLPSKLFTVAPIVEDCAVRTMEAQAGRVTAAVTENGTVRTGSVLLAGGTWSSYFATNLGLDSPQLMVRSTVGRTRSLPGKEMPNISIEGFAIPGGLFIGTGLSGDGFGIGPAVGRILADLIQRQAPGHDLSRFRFGRFTDGSPIVPGPY